MKISLFHFRSEVVAARSGRPSVSNYTHEMQDGLVFPGKNRNSKVMASKRKQTSAQIRLLHFVSA